MELNKKREILESCKKDINQLKTVNIVEHKNKIDEKPFVEREHSYSYTHSNVRIRKHDSNPRDIIRKVEKNAGVNSWIDGI